MRVLDCMDTSLYIRIHQFKVKLNLVIQNAEGWPAIGEEHKAKV